MKKSLLLSIGLAFSVYCTASAYVVAGSIDETNLHLTYPLVYTDDQSSQEAINSDIADLVYDVKQQYDDGTYYSAAMKYEVTYEDNDVISLLIHDSIVRSPGAAHGSNQDTGLVYDKHTGARIPLSNYVTIASPEQMQSALEDGVLKAYSWNGARNYYFTDHGWNVKEISSNYILTGNGNLYLIYQPYEMGPFAAGAVKIEFLPSAIDYFSRINS